MLQIEIWLYSPANENEFDLNVDGDVALSCHQRTHSVLLSTVCCAVQIMKSIKRGLVQMTGLRHKRFLFSFFSFHSSFRNSATSRKMSPHAEEKTLIDRRAFSSWHVWSSDMRKKTNSGEVKFGCIVPEKLRLWDGSDCSAVSYSLLPFEYGPSSEETAKGRRCPVMMHRGYLYGNAAVEGWMSVTIPSHIMTAAHAFMLWTAPCVICGALEGGTEN